MSTPRISIVTCSYRQARFLDATMRSVLSQCWPGLEYIVVDGGSDDGSREIIQNHADRLAWWVSETDEGQTDALIKGFAHATGDICGWLCSDDLLLPGALEKVARYFEAHPEVEAVYGNALWIDIDGCPLRAAREMPFSRFIFLHGFNYIPQPSMFWRKSLYERVGGLTPGLHIAMDNDLWEKFSRVTRIAHMDAYLSCMRFYPEQKTIAPQWRARGQMEGDHVMERGSRLARHARSLRPLLLPTARALRVLVKAAIGAYGARVPDEYLSWLEAHATREC